MSISGNLRTMPFADLLQWISQSRKTGTLVVEGDSSSKKIYFRDGLVVAAASGNPKEFLGYYLVGWGYLSEEELHHMLSMQERHGTLLGELLVIVGHLSREELHHILRVKTEEAVYQLFLWDEGAFRFLDDILPSSKFHPCNLPVDGLILEGVRRVDEEQRIREVLPDDRHVVKVVRAVDVDSMGEVELSILREINGRQSVEEIARATRLGTFHVAEFVYHGVNAELLEVLPPSSEESAIPGYSRESWRSVAGQASSAMDSGNFGKAHDLLAELRDRFPTSEEAQQTLSSGLSKLESELEELGIGDSAVPELAVPMAELTTLELNPEEGFLVSRLTSGYAVKELVRLIPGEALRTKLVLAGLVQRSVVKIRGHERAVGSDASSA